jgi:hypothetical protein
MCAVHALIDRDISAGLAQIGETNYTSRFKRTPADPLALPPLRASVGNFQKLEDRRKQVDQAAP